MVFPGSLQLGEQGLAETPYSVGHFGQSLVCVSRLLTTVPGLLELRLKFSILLKQNINQRFLKAFRFYLDAFYLVLLLILVMAGILGVISWTLLIERVYKIKNFRDSASINGP
jgi:hypothetical protein